MAGAIAPIRQWEPSAADRKYAPRLRPEVPGLDVARRSARVVFAVYQPGRGFLGFFSAIESARAVVGNSPGTFVMQYFLGDLRLILATGAVWSAERTADVKVGMIADLEWAFDWADSGDDF